MSSWTSLAVKSLRLSPTGVHFTRVPLVLYHDGSLTHVQPTSIKSRCSIDKHRPNDSFTCKLKFGSWTYDGNMFDIKMKAGERGFDMTLFQQNPNYAVISTNSTRHVEYYPCCAASPTSTSRLKVTLQRRQWLRRNRCPPIIFISTPPRARVHQH
ncbi:acetylcholine receptor subunit alpha-L1-like [Gigantopelta aegis]|uniref:acetylcholine receptor subunit alpha-L1-like n=1 Tax=Gigantopelta aegis TaxID=1735272 RepID=UPI001B88D50F|nr:acetylcholine receptor subunit alpha-L1-like [Gigantopelta aegis]